MNYTFSMEFKFFQIKREHVSKKLQCGIFLKAISSFFQEKAKISRVFSAFESYLRVYFNSQDIIIKIINRKDPLNKSCMSCNQFITFHKSLLNKRYEENDTNINPFGNLLFSENWNWSQTYPSLPQKIKVSAQKSSIKLDILSWTLCFLPIFQQQRRFNDLSIEQKAQCTVISNTTFIEQLLKIYPKYKACCLYNLPTQKKLPDLLALYDDHFLKLLYEHTKMAWTTQPKLYIEPTEIVFSGFVQWVQNVSNGKIFEYAHRVSNRNDPQENLLWFNSLSFHRMEGWLVNQLQKAIIKHYFDKNFTQIEKIQNLKAYLDDRGLIREISLLSVPIKDCTLNMYNSAIRDSLKKNQENHIDRMQEKLIDDIQLKNPKKKKIKRKKIKKNVTMPVIAGNFGAKQTINQKKKQTSLQKQQNKSQNNLLNEEENIISVKQQQQKQRSSVRSDIAQNFQHRRQCLNRDQVEFELAELSPRNNKNQKDDLYEKQLTPNIKKHYPVEEFCEQFKKSMVSEDNINNGYDKKQARSGDSYSPPSITNKSQTMITFQGTQLKQQQSNWQQEDVNQSRKRKKKKVGGKKENSLPHKDIASKVCSMLLNRQLNNFIDSLSIQTNQLYECKVIAFQRVRFFIKSLFPTAQAVLFGSNAVGLSLPSSDIDIMLFNLPCQFRQQANQILAQVAIQINTMGWIHSCSTYLSAKVPIVKLEIDPSVPYLETKRKSDCIGMLDPRFAYFLELKDKKKVKSIKVDLTINLLEESHTGAQSTELMKKWMSDFPMMHRILIALKYILANRGLNQNFRGGIGSYCLFVMVAAFIRESQLKGEPVKQESSLFMSVLKFYGEDFENQLKCIKLVDQGSCYQEISLTQINYNYDSLPQLYIFDPINHRVMSGSFYQYNTIKAEFRRIRNQILEEQNAIQKEMIFCYSASEVNKMLANKKSIERWMHKYEIRSGFCIHKIIDGR